MPKMMYTNHNMTKVEHKMFARLFDEMCRLFATDAAAATLNKPSQPSPAAEPAPASAPVLPTGTIIQATKPNYAEGVLAGDPFVVLSNEEVLAAADMLREEPNRRVAIDMFGCVFDFDPTSTDCYMVRPDQYLTTAEVPAAE